MKMELYTGLGQKVSRVYYIGTKPLSRMLELRPALSRGRQERREDVRVHWTVKVPSKHIELVRSNGRVTDTSSAETNLATATSPAAPGACTKVSKLLAAYL
jgi:hypothetical protein